MLRPSTSTLFPYTTLFRSHRDDDAHRELCAATGRTVAAHRWAGLAAAHCTTRVATICGWGVQWKAYAPGSSGAVNVTVLPGATATSNSPSSEVTVCPTWSSFVTVTWDPAGTLAGSS